MEQKKWEKLSHDLAVEVITMDLADIMVPCHEGRQRAVNLLEQKQQNAINVEYRAGQVLIALKKLGYNVVLKS